MKRPGSLFGKKDVFDRSNAILSELISSCSRQINSSEDIDTKLVLALVQCLREANKLHRLYIEEQEAVIDNEAERLLGRVKEMLFSLKLCDESLPVEEHVRLACYELSRLRAAVTR